MMDFIMLAAILIVVGVALYTGGHPLYKSGAVNYFTWSGVYEYVCDLIHGVGQRLRVSK